MEPPSQVAGRDADAPPPAQLTNVVLWRWLVVLLAVCAPVVLRLGTSTGTLRLSYGLALFLSAAASLVLVIRTLRAPEWVSRGWVAYGIGLAIAAGAGGVDAVTSTGDRRLGFLVAILVGVPIVFIGFRRVFDMANATLEDALDSALVAIVASLFAWTLRYDGQVMGMLSPGLGAVAMIYVFISVAVAAVVLLSGRAEGVLNPVRGLLSAGLLLQALGMVVATDALQGGRYADNPLASGLTALGIVLMVLAFWAGLAVDPGKAVTRHRTAMWWLPMALVLAGYGAHTVVKILMPGAGATDLVEATLTVAGSALLAIRIVRTVRHRERLANQIRNERARLETLLNDVRDQVLLIDDAGKVVEVVGSGPADLFADGETIGHSLLEVVHPDDLQAATSAFAAAAADPGQPKPLTGRARRADGTTAYVEGVVIDHRHDPIIGRLALTFRDITTRRRAELELESLALFDPLTGLPNRESVRRELTAALETCNADAPVAVMFADLDRLKVINDSLGHQVGDEVIREVARRWEAVLPTGSLLGRVSGDEFVVCYRRGDRILSSDGLARLLLRCLTDPMQLGVHRLTVSASVGIVTVNDPSTTPESALRDADVALYEAKSAGRNGFSFFDSGMRDAALERLVLERDLRDALEEGDVTIHLQPIVHLADGRPKGFEALVRWHHPERGFVPPPSIIGVAEDTGMIMPLGDHVLQLACEAIADIRRATGAPLNVSVNVSPIQLAQSAFLSTVQAALAAHDLPPAALTLEVTESTLLDPEGRARSTLQALHQGGVQISLDDFGTGYSSLSYLGTFPLDQLKLDRSFVTAAAGTPTGEAVMEGILHITRSLAIPVVAEGLETADDVAQLLVLGAAYGQGWHYSRALPVAEALAYVRNFAHPSDAAHPSG